MSRASRRRGAGATLRVEEAEWLPEVRDDRTPESLLIEAEEAAERAAETRLVAPHLAHIPRDEAFALVFHEGLFGEDPIGPVTLARLLRLSGPAEVRELVQRAREQIGDLRREAQGDAPRTGEVRASGI